MNFDHLRQIRRNFISLIEGLTLDQANATPSGYNNSVLWNFGHCIVTQQLLCNKLSGHEVYVSTELINEFKKGAKPTRDVTSEELASIKELALSLIDRLEEDYNAGKLSGFETYTTSFKVELNSIEETIAFLSLHEGLHLGYAMAQRKVV